jgi:hypothetical protein
MAEEPAIVTLGLGFACAWGTMHTIVANNRTTNIDFIRDIMIVPFEVFEYCLVARTAFCHTQGGEF